MTHSKTKNGGYLIVMNGIVGGRYDNPCPNCITFAICRASMYQSLKDNNTPQHNKALLMDFISNIDSKCPKLTQYIQSTREESVKLVGFICQTLRETFK